MIHLKNDWFRKFLDLQFQILPFSYGAIFNCSEVPGMFYKQSNKKLIHFRPWNPSFKQFLADVDG